MNCRTLPRTFCVETTYRYNAIRHLHGSIHFHPELQWPIAPNANFKLCLHKNTILLFVVTYRSQLRSMAHEHQQREGETQGDEM